jgi:hypothetical protein
MLNQSWPRSVSFYMSPFTSNLILHIINKFVWFWILVWNFPNIFVSLFKMENLFTIRRILYRVCKVQHASQFHKNVDFVSPVISVFKTRSCCNIWYHNFLSHYHKMYKQATYTIIPILCKIINDIFSEPNYQYLPAMPILEHDETMD